VEITEQVGYLTASIRKIMTMSTNETMSANPSQAPSKDSAVRNVRKRKKAEGRKKRTLKLRTDKEFAKQYFEGKSKRATDKKSGFRKKKSKKK
jgi:hypothetical protein